MNMNMNPMQILAMIKRGQNPQQIILSMLSSRAQANPVMSNLLDLAKQGKGDDIEAFARNLAREKGIDFDKEFGAFKDNFLNL